MPTRYVLPLLAFLLGGGGTGIGLSMANDPGKEVTEAAAVIATKVDANAETLRALKSTIETIAVTVVEMKADAKIATNDRSRLEERVRNLERWREGFRE